MQPAGENTGMLPMSDALDRLAGDAPILAFRYPRGFMPSWAVVNSRGSIADRYRTGDVSRC